jgi:hypothetical protein
LGAVAYCGSQLSWPDGLTGTAQQAARPGRLGPRAAHALPMVTARWPREWWWASAVGGVRPCDQVWGNWR